MKPLTNFELIEIQLDWVDAGNKIIIPFNTNFREKKIVLIQVFDEGMNQRAPSGRKMFHLESVPGYLTLYDINGISKIKQAPLAIFKKNIWKQAFSYPFEELIIDNARSYIEYPGIVIDPVSITKSFLMAFHFKD